MFTELSIATQLLDPASYRKILAWEFGVGEGWKGVSFILDRSHCFSPNINKQKFFKLEFAAVITAVTSKTMERDLIVDCEYIQY